MLATTKINELFLTSQNDIARLMTEMRKLQKDSSYANLTPFRFDAGNYTEVVYISIPMASNKKSFKVSLSKNNFIDQIIDRIAEGVKEVIDGEESTSLAAQWVLEAMAVRYEDEMTSAAIKYLDLDVVRRMSPELGAAMMTDANLSYDAFRHILRYLKYHLNGKGILPTETNIRNLIPRANLPNCKRITFQNEIIKYFWEGVDTTVTCALPYVLQHDVLQNAAKVHLVLGADHGQGAFLGTVKVIFKDANNRTVGSYELVMGQIECKKDTFDLLKQTIFPTWNESLHRLKKNKVIVFDKNTDEAASLNMPYIISFEEEAPQTTSANVLPLVIEHMVMTGDIQFYTLCLGKEHSSGSWCWACRLSHKQWQLPVEKRENINAEDKEPWTIDTLCDHATQITGGDQTRTRKPQPNIKRGVSHTPPIDALDINMYVPPPLHLQLGLVNHAWNKGFKLWVDNRVEDVPEEILLTRSELIMAELKTDQMGDDIDELKQDISDLVGEKMDINAKLKERDANKQLVLRLQSKERLEVKETYTEIAQRLALLREEKKDLCEILERLKKDKQKAKKKFDEAKKKCTWEDRLMVAKIEEILEEHNISMGQYHGRDLEGPATHRLLQNSNEIFRKIKDLLLKDCKSGIPPAEIEEMCESYRYLFLLLESLFHYIRKPNESFTSNDKKNLQRVVLLTMKQWRALNLSVTVKAHIIEDHLIDYIERYGGLGDFHEEFIERLHQDTKRFRRRMGHLQDFKKKCDAVTCWRRLENLDIVKDAQQKVAYASKRNLKRYKDGLESESNENKKAHREKIEKSRENLLTELESIEGFGSKSLTDNERFRVEQS